VDIGAYEAKTHIAAMLKRVARGERITITKHGKPVAMLVPPPDSAAMTPEEAIEGIRRNREGARLDGLSIRALIEEGRR